MKNIEKKSFTLFVEELVAQLKARGKFRTAETYAATLRSFNGFRGNKDILISAINEKVILMYENYLRNVRGVTRNSSSFYMRILRAIYNKAVEAGLAKPRQLFKHVYTGVDRTIKRAIPLCAMKKIIALDLSGRPALEKARDIFLFSFFTRGMSFVDIAFLKKSNIKNGELVYCRHKTGQQLRMRWEKCMSELVEKHGGSGSFLLALINEEKSDYYRQYRSALCLTNSRLKVIGGMVGLSTPLTMYVARHSWASAAHCKRIPLSVIREGMGHDNETTTRIYLASLENAVIDKANSKIIKSLFL